MTSPICQVKDGAGAYVPTSGGVNVTPGDTITINLVSSAGVNSWSISCVTTDELSVAATVNAGLTIDPVAKTATYTAPVSGRTYRFQSQVNSGLGVNGVVDPTLTTTFCVYTLTTGGARVIAVDETTEGSPSFGWIGSLNPIIRNPSGATTPSGTGLRKVVSGSEPGTASLLVDADVSASAAIAPSKLGATGTNGNVVRQAAGATGLGSLDLSLSACVGATKLGAANGGTGVDSSAFTGLFNYAAGVPSAFAGSITGQVASWSGSAWTAQGGTAANGKFYTYAGSTGAWGNTATFYADTGTAAATGALRLSNASPGVVQRNSGNTADIVGISFSTTDAYVGSDTTGAASQATNVRCYPSSAGIFGISNVNYLIWQSSSVIFRQAAFVAAGMGGESASSAPFKWLKATVAMVGATTLTAAQYTCPYLALTGTPGNVNLVFPTIDGAEWIINNLTNASITVKTAAGTGFAIAPTTTNRQRILCDGTNIIPLSPAA